MANLRDDEYFSGMDYDNLSIEEQEAADDFLSRDPNEAIDYVLNEIEEEAERRPITEFYDSEDELTDSISRDLDNENWYSFSTSAGPK